MEDGTINAIDIIVLLVIGVSVIIAFTRGFTTEALSLGAWVAAVFVTLQGHPYVFPYVVEFIQPDFMASTISYAALGILSLIILKFVAGFIGDSVKESHIGALDRGLGILFGVARGMLLISFVYLVTSAFISKGNYPEWFENAKSRPLIEYGGSVLNALNPYKDSTELEERRKDLEALDRLKDMVPSFPSSGEEEEGARYENESREELNKLIEQESNV